MIQFLFIIFIIIQEYLCKGFTLVVFFKLLLVKVLYHLFKIYHFTNKFLSPLLKIMINFFLYYKNYIKNSNIKTFKIIVSKKQIHFFKPIKYVN